MKRKLIYVFVVIVIVVLVQVLVNNTSKSEEKIVTAFGNVDFANKGGSVEAEVNYGNSYLSEEAKKSLMDDLAQKIGLNDDYVFNVQKNTSEEVLSITKEAKNATTLIKFVSIENEVEDNVLELEQYIIVTITFKNSVESLIAYKSELENIFETMDLNAELTINLTGEYSGKLGDSTKEEIVDNLLTKMKAKIVSQNKDSEVYTVYAYTNLVDNTITVDGDEVNVNIAIKYDETRDITSVLLSSPIINGDY